MLITVLMFITLSAYCILDYYHTVALVGFGMSETNPIVLWLIGPDQNWEVLLYTKVLFLTMLGVSLGIKYIKQRRRTYE